MNSCCYDTRVLTSFETMGQSQASWSFVYITSVLKTYVYMLICMFHNIFLWFLELFNAHKTRFALSMQNSTNT